MGRGSHLVGCSACSILRRMQSCTGVAEVLLVGVSAGLLAAPMGSTAAGEEAGCGVSVAAAKAAGAEAPVIAPLQPLPAALLPAGEDPAPALRLSGAACRH